MTSPDNGSRASGKGVRLALGYAVLATLWVLAAALIATATADPWRAALLSTFGMLGLVGATALLLFLVARRGANEDIAERRRSLAALEESERRLREAESLAHVGHWRVDGSGRYSWSDETCRIYGLDPRVTTPSPEVADERVHPEDRARVAEYRAQIARGGGDRTRLVALRQNLLDNAVKFMGTQGVPRIDVGFEGEDPEVVFYVRDNGAGIDPRFHEKVFGLFEKLDAAIEGSGLGLALVRRIVEAHDGRIWVESGGEGRGSCFRFTLPAAVRAGHAGVIP